MLSLLLSFAALWDLMLVVLVVLSVFCSVVFVLLIARTAGLVLVGLHNACCMSFYALLGWFPFVLVYLLILRVFVAFGCSLLLWCLFGCLWF